MDNKMLEYSKESMQLAHIYDIAAGTVAHAFQKIGPHVGAEVVMMTALAVHNYLSANPAAKVHLNDTLDLAAISIAGHLSGSKPYAKVEDYADMKSWKHDKAFDTLWGAIAQRQEQIKVALNSQTTIAEEPIFPPIPPVPPEPTEQPCFRCNCCSKDKERDITITINIGKK